MSHDEFLSHEAELLDLARRRAGSRADAEDVVQEVWLEALRRPPRDRTRFAAWLRVVTLHAARRSALQARSRAARERAVARPERIPSVAEILARESALAALPALVARLDEPYRSVIQMRYFEGIPIVEVAARLGRDPATVRSQLKRGLDQLRDRLDARRDPRGSWRYLTSVFGLVRPRRGWTRVGTWLMVRAGAALLAAVACVSLLAALWREPRAREDDPLSAAPPEVAAEWPPTLATGATARRAVPSIDTAGPPPAPLAREAHAAGVELGGRVLGAVTSRAVAEARILAAEQDHPDDGRVVAISGARGEFLARFPTLPVWVWAEHDRFSPTARHLVDLPFVSSAGGLELFMHERGRLRGSVVDARGHPVAAAEVRLMTRGGTKGTFGGRQRVVERGSVKVRTVSDERGRFELPRCASPRMRLEVEHPTAPPWSGWVDREDEDLRIELPEPAGIQGTLFGPGGEPIGDAPVAVAVEARWMRATRTDASGAFELVGLPAGEFALVGSDPTAGSRLSVVHAGRIREGERLSLGGLPLSTAWTLAGRAVDGEQPLAGWTVHLTRSDLEGGPPGDGQRECRTAHDGAFAFLGCPREAHELRFFSPDEEPTVPRASMSGVRPGELVILSPRCAGAPSAIVAGSFELDQGAERKGLRFELESASLSGPLAVAVDGEGRFELGPLPAGRFRLRAAMEGLGPCELQAFDLAGTERLELGRMSVPRPGALRVRLVTPAGVRLAGYEFHLLREGVAIRSSTIAPGRKLAMRPGVPSFRVDDLWPSTYELIVRAAFFADGYAEVSVREGELGELEIPLRPGAQGYFRVTAPRELEKDETLSVWIRAPGERFPARIDALKGRVVRSDPGCVLSFKAGIPSDATAIEVRSTRGLVGTLDVEAAPIVQGGRYQVELRDP